MIVLVHGLKELNLEIGMLNEVRILLLLNELEDWQSKGEKNLILVNWKIVPRRPQQQVDQVQSNMELVGTAENESA